MQTFRRKRLTLNEARARRQLRRDVRLLNAFCDAHFRPCDVRDFAATQIPRAWASQHRRAWNRKRMAEGGAR